MFSANDLIDVMLSDDIKTSKKEKYLYRVLTSDDFYGWLFNPPISMGIEKTKENIYNAMTRNKSLKILWSCLRDYSIEDFPRTAAVFIFSLCNYAADLCNKDARILMQHIKQVISIVSNVTRSMKEQISVSTQ